MSDLDLSAFPIAVTRVNELVSQWNADDSPQFYSLILQKLQLFDEVFLTPFRFAAVQNSINEAEGIFLDWIGKRIGLSRPIFDTSLLLQFFGFSVEDVGFNQGPFKSIDPILGQNIGIDDIYYRLLLHGRAKYIFTDGTVDDIEDVYNAIFLSARIEETANEFELQLTVDDFGLPFLWRIMKRVNIIWKPMCCNYVIPFGLSSLTAGTGELFRFVITVASGENMWRSTGTTRGFVFGRIELSDGLIINEIIWRNDRTFIARFEDGDATSYFSATSAINIYIYNEDGQLLAIDSTSFMSSTATEATWRFSNTQEVTRFRAGISAGDKLLIVFANIGVEIREP